jgi:hypothetical protein
MKFVVTTVRQSESNLSVILGELGKNCSTKVQDSCDSKRFARTAGWYKVQCLKNIFMVWVRFRKKRRIHGRYSRSGEQLKSERAPQTEERVFARLFEGSLEKQPSLGPLWFFLPTH